MDPWRPGDIKSGMCGHDPFILPTDQTPEVIQFFRSSEFQTLEVAFAKARSALDRRDLYDVIAAARKR